MLEAQNKRHDIIVKHQESEARLQDLQVKTSKDLFSTLDAHESKILCLGKIVQ